MKTVTAAQMAELDRQAIEDLKIPAETLMENAGREVAQEAKRIAKGKRIAIICGKGNNGGDGLVAARYLQEAGYIVKIVKASEVKTAYLDLKNYDLIIDAIFGIGLNKPVEPPYSDIIIYINSLNKPVLAVDVPSGLNATTGQVMGVAVKATETIAFAVAKTGFYQNDGPKCCGKIIVVDIGIPI